MKNPITMRELMQAADQINRTGKVLFFAKALAAGMDKASVEAAMESGKRRHSGVVISDTAAIQSAAAFKDITLTFPKLEDGTRLIKGIGFIVDADGVMEQLEKLFTAEFQRVSGGKSEYTLGAYLLGPAASQQGGHTDDDAFASRTAAMQNFIKVEDLPIDAVPFNKQFKIKITGGVDATPAEGFSDVVNITAVALVEDLMNTK
ncbi:MAG: hypothetical protein V3V10_02215 [Planctomycetota bacterium]